MAAFADEFLLEIEEFFAETNETLAPSPTHCPGSPFSFGSDPDLGGIFRIQVLSPPRSPPFWDCLEADLEEDLAADGLEWEESVDPANANGTDGASVPAGGGGSGTGGGVGVVVDDVFAFTERDYVFSDEQPFDSDEGQELDDLFASEGWGAVLPAELDEDEFEVFPVHMVDALVVGARHLPRGQPWSGSRWWWSAGRTPRRGAPCARTAS
jgi:hypothetical protein